MEIAHKVTRKSRTAMSCERCKIKKTKCSNPVPGPCDSCRTADAVCHIDAGKRRQRPYYFVSEEEYRHMQNILKYYLPNIDLNPSTLRWIASQCQNSRREDGAQASPMPNATATAVTRDSEPAPSEQEDDLALREIVNLHEDLGCMLADAQGQYRYVGADSGISFNSAVRALKKASPQKVPDKDVIPGMDNVRLPMAGAKATTLPQLMTQYRLPPKGLLLQYAKRYFAQVHCQHWIYSSEEFYARLQTSYGNEDKPLASSWLCSIYCIFTLGALSSPTPQGTAESHSADSYLGMAKSLVPQVCDEADLDSIRALFLLALALQSSAFSNSAYLYTGVAVRVAFSLGLHLDKYSCPDDSIQTEHARRIWWSLYIYDQELSLRVGKPCMIGAQGEVSWQPLLPSEEILSPGPYTPPGYLQLSIALTQITKSARNRLYVEPISGGRRLSLSAFDAHLNSLRDWLTSVPTYLRHDAPCPPLHKRSVAMLHVRYWTTVMFVSRPFLLCVLLRRAKLQSTSSLERFETISGFCIDAAKESLKILQKVVEDNLLSSVLVSDFYYALDLLQIFLVAYALDRSEAHLNNTRSTLEILKSMSSSGYCERMLPEVLNQLKEWGVIRVSYENPNDFQELDTSLAGMEAGDEFYDMLFNGNELHNDDPSSIDPFNANMGDELMRQVLDLTNITHDSAIF